MVRTKRERREKIGGSISLFMNVTLPDTHGRSYAYFLLLILTFKFPGCGSPCTKPYLCIIAITKFEKSCPISFKLTLSLFIN